MASNAPPTPTFTLSPLSSSDESSQLELDDENDEQEEQEQQEPIVSPLQEPSVSRPPSRSDSPYINMDF